MAYSCCIFTTSLVAYFNDQNRRTITTTHEWLMWFQFTQISLNSKNKTPVTSLGAIFKKIYISFCKWFIRFAVYTPDGGKFTTGNGELIMYTYELIQHMYWFTNMDGLIKQNSRLIHISTICRYFKSFSLHTFLPRPLKQHELNFQPNLIKVFIALI